MIHYLKLIACLVVIDLNAQTFTGEVLYQVILNPLKQEVNDTARHLYAQNGDYIISTVSNPNVTSVYKAADGALYAIDSISSIVTVINTETDFESTIGFKPTVHLLDSVYCREGREWNIVEVQWKGGQYLYFYDPDILKVEAELFKRHNFDQFYEFLKISGSLPTRIDKSVKGMGKVSLEIIEFKKYSSGPSGFQVPKLKTIPGLTSFYPNKKLYKIDE